MNRRDVVEAFARGKPAKAGNIYTDGTTAYSYRDNYPIARHLDPYTVIVNTERFSMTTTQHIRAIERALAAHGYCEQRDGGCKLDNTFDAQLWLRPS